MPNKTLYRAHPYQIRYQTYPKVLVTVCLNNYGIQETTNTMYHTQHLTHVYISHKKPTLLMPSKISYLSNVLKCMRMGDACPHLPRTYMYGKVMQVKVLHHKNI